MKAARLATTLTTSAALGSAALALQEAPAKYTFDDPVALEADGKRIDVTAEIGHAGPLVRDFDGDGKRDLLVSAFRGNIEFFRNVGEDDAPRYESRGKLKTHDGELLKFHNW